MKSPGSCFLISLSTAETQVPPVAWSWTVRARRLGEGRGDARRERGASLLALLDAAACTLALPAGRLQREAGDAQRRAGLVLVREALPARRPAADRAPAGLRAAELAGAGEVEVRDALAGVVVDAEAELRASREERVAEVLLHQGRRAGELHGELLLARLALVDDEGAGPKLRAVRARLSRADEVHPEVLEERAVAAHGAGLPAHHGVEVAVAVEVRESGGAVEAHVAEPEGARGSGHEEGDRRRLGVEGDEERAVGLAEHGLDLGVVDDVREGQREVAAQPREAEGVRVRGREGRRLRRAVVPAEVEAAVVVADHQVEVAVLVEVHEGRRRPVAEAAGAEGIGLRRGEGRRGRRARILEEEQDAPAGGVSHQEIEVAVAVEVAEGRRRVGAGASQPEGIRDGRGEARARLRARVLGEQQRAVVGSDEAVEIAVPVEVAELRRAALERAREPEGLRRGPERGLGPSAAVAVEEHRVADVADHRVEVAVGVEVGKGRARALRLGDEAEGVAVGSHEDRVGR